jgi:hypothetical protein
MEDFIMKKLLALILALSAVFCFAGCEDGKCDECGRKSDDVKVYEKLDDQELCAICAAKELGESMFG